jgi:hypothetical protein
MSTHAKYLIMKLRELFKHTKSAIGEVQDLQEIKMSPTSLMGMAKNIDFRVGMEFEMIVPSPGMGEPEPDYYEDQNVEGGINGVLGFFSNNNLNPREKLKRARRRMEDEFLKWTEDKPPDELEDATDEQWIQWQNDWFSDSLEIDMMSDVPERFDLQWPFQTREPAPVNVYDEAKSFSEAIGREVNASHIPTKALREPGKYAVEPDASLNNLKEQDREKYRKPGDLGLEFISPPLPMDEMFRDLERVREWAKKRGCYTDHTTGLHINVSVANWKGGLNNIDYVKLVLLLGDEHVLRQFNRVGNEYAYSSLGDLRDIVQGSPQQTQKLLDQLKSDLNTAASKLIHTGDTDKYVSVNTKDKANKDYIEFRGPGENWLGSNFDKIRETTLRFAVALDAATDPQKYRQEYQKKLYQTLTKQQRGRDSETGKISQEPIKDPKTGRARLPSQDTQDPMIIFSQYAAGSLTAEQIKNILRQRQGTKPSVVVLPPPSEEKPQPQPSKSPTTGTDTWQVVDRATGQAIHSFDGGAARDRSGAYRTAVLWLIQQHNQGQYTKTKSIDVLPLK